MGKRKQIEPSAPSKAYLVSFGDTMTALLAFFIVLNSLAKEQTGAKMYSGTGSFASAFSNSAVPGSMPGNRSRNMIQAESQKPIYALKDNLEKNEGKVGPDDSDEQDQIKDRDKEQFQKFLDAVDKSVGLKQTEVLTNQTVLDSFQPFDSQTNAMSKQAVQMLSECITKMRDPKIRMEVILWADLPSQKGLANKMEVMQQVKKEVHNLFWLSVEQQKRIRFRVKPWLFADAKRPVFSVVLAKQR